MTIKGMTLIVRKLSVCKESYLLLSQSAFHLKPRLTELPPDLLLVFLSRGRACFWRSLPWCSAFHRLFLISGPGSALAQKPSAPAGSGGSALPEFVRPAACAPVHVPDWPWSGRP